MAQSCVGVRASACLRYPTRVALRDVNPTINRELHQDARRIGTADFPSQRLPTTPVVMDVFDATVGSQRLVREAFDASGGGDNDVVQLSL